MKIDAKQETTTIDFAVLKLQSGTWLQLQSMEGAGNTHAVEFVAAVHGKTLFVAMADVVTTDIRIRSGERYLVRGFNGVSDFAFTSHVLEVQTKPFVNVHLTYPDFVQSKVVREVLRMSTSLPASVKIEGDHQSIAVSVNDLSVAGALIESAAPLGEIDARIEISLPVRFEATETELHLPAMIRHVEWSSSSAAFRSGVEFADVTREDKLVLYYLLFTLAGGGR